MTLQQIMLLVATVVFMSIGQILFKFAANDLSGVELAVYSDWYRLLSPWLIAALLFYAISTFLWVWVLQITSLSRAYPFVALAFVIVPFLSWWLIGERFRWNALIGAVFILIGVIISSID